MTGTAFNSRKLTPPTDSIGTSDYAGNFDTFLNAAPTNSPWCFWYGAIEPHRGYEFGSGVAKGGKKLSDIDRVPGYWPDNDTVRNDMLDYAFEVEHFDTHLGRMLDSLSKRGLLPNTLVIVTSDHAMPFPRVKGNAYEFANHIPLAAMWPAGIPKPGRAIDDFVSFVDIAPTLIEVAGLGWKETGMAPTVGRSLTGIFRSEESGLIDPARDHVLIGKERTDIGRPNDAGYPIRGLVKDGWLYLRNYESSRWPAGNPETGYLDCDAGATKSLILDARRASGTDRFWDYCFGKRPETELYDLRNDPDCLTNLAAHAASAPVAQRLSATMETELKAQGDPRMAGQGTVFDQYLHAAPANVGFYERFMRGEPVKAGWVNETDFEKPGIR